MWYKHLDGEISFAQLSAAVDGWLGYVRHARTWALQDYLLEDYKKHKYHLT